MNTNTARKLPVIAIFVAHALLAGSPVSAQLEMLNMLCINHFGSNQQPRTPFETRTQSTDGKTTFLSTAQQILPTGDSFGPNPPNMIPTKYENAESCRGTPIPNTLPSRPGNPYNLHPTPSVSPIDKTSPTDDLDRIMDELESMLVVDDELDSMLVGDATAVIINAGRAQRLAQDAIDIIEGNTLSGDLTGRVYEGFPLLHYLGGLKTKSVDPITKTVTVNQIWYDSHIESDTAYIDPTIVDDEEWKIIYHVNMLSRSHDDFAPYAMFFDDPDELDFRDVGGMNMAGMNIPNVGMDQTFFPMEDGLRYTYEMKMPPARFWNLTYHWGWRNHPPRVQVVENVKVLIAGGMPRNFAEIMVFGQNPRASERTKLAAIDMIGDHAPAKRMWRMFRELESASRNSVGETLEKSLNTTMPKIRQAFYDWQNRNKLPTGFVADPDADMSILFINNTMYGEIKGHDGRAEVRIDHLWTKKGDKVRIELLNGDYFPHAYVLVDFGGLRGWENTFHNTLPLGGGGPLFTFGRNYFWIHVAGGGPIPVPPANRSELPLVTNQVLSMESVFKKKNHKRKWVDLSVWGDLMDPVAEARTADYQITTDASVRGELADPPAAETRTVGGIGQHTVEVTFNYQPARRLRMYQFDALHHDVAVWSVH